MNVHTYYIHVVLLFRFLAHAITCTYNGRIVPSFYGYFISKVACSIKRHSGATDKAGLYLRQKAHRRCSASREGSSCMHASSKLFQLARRYAGNFFSV